MHVYDDLPIATDNIPDNWSQIACALEYAPITTQAPQSIIWLHMHSHLTPKWHQRKESSVHVHLCFIGHRYAAWKTTKINKWKLLNVSAVCHDLEASFPFIIWAAYSNRGRRGCSRKHQDGAPVHVRLLRFAHYSFIHWWDFSTQKGSHFSSPSISTRSLSLLQKLIYSDCFKSLLHDLASIHVMDMLIGSFRIIKVSFSVTFHCSLIPD